MMKLLAPFFPAPVPSGEGNCRLSRTPIRFGREKNEQAPPPGMWQDIDTLDRGTAELALANPLDAPVAEPGEPNQVNAPNRAARLDLLRAVKEGSAEDVQTQLDAGADPNARDRLMYTALHRAVDQGNVDIVSRLLRAGADPNARAPLYAALPVPRHPDTDRAQQIAQVAGDTATFSPVLPATPLERALQHKKLEVIPTLMLGGATCTDAQRPHVQEALKQIYHTRDLKSRLELAVIALDHHTAQVLLSAGVQSNKLPVLYANMLEAAIDTSKSMQTGEIQEERLNRLRIHQNSLRMMRLLNQYVPDHRFLADMLARNWATLLQAPRSPRAAAQRVSDYAADSALP